MHNQQHSHWEEWQSDRLKHKKKLRCDLTAPMVCTYVLAASALMFFCCSFEIRVLLTSSSKSSDRCRAKDAA